METATPENENKVETIGPDPVVKKPVVVERFRDEERSARYRFNQFVGRFADHTVTISGLGLFLFPFIFIGSLTLDMPVMMFDGWSAVSSLKPSQWLSRGDLFLTMSMYLAVLMTRRHGAAIAVQALGMAWIINIVICGLLLIYLAPQLEDGDMPRTLFLVGFIVSWYGGTRLAIYMYDVTRGGRWWRAPFMAIFLGLIVQAFTFFAMGYGGTGAPWGLWFIADMAIKALFAAVFLGLYRLLRGRVLPRTGLGGR